MKKRRSKPERSPIVVQVTVTVKSALPLIVDTVKIRLERLGWRVMSVSRSGRSTVLEFAVDITSYYPGLKD